MNGMRIRMEEEDRLQREQADSMRRGLVACEAVRLVESEAEVPPLEFCVVPRAALLLGPGPYWSLSWWVWPEILFQAFSQPM